LILVRLLSLDALSTTYTSSGISQDSNELRQSIVSSALFQFTVNAAMRFRGGTINWSIQGLIKSDWG